MFKNVKFSGIFLQLGDVLTIHNSNASPYKEMKNRDYVIKNITKNDIILAPKSACYKQTDGTYEIKGEEEVKISWKLFSNFETTGHNIYKKERKKKKATE